MAGFLDLFRGGQQPLQAQQPQQQGGLFSGRLGGLNDPSVALPLAAALMQPGDIGSNLGQGFAMAGQGMETRRKLQQERAMENATAKYLEAQGADAGLVEMARNGGGAQALSAWSQLRKDPMDDLRLKTAQLQYDKLAQGDDEEYYGNPINLQDEQGNPYLGQLSNKGNIKRIDTGGLKITPGVQKVDLGDSWGFADKAGNIISTQPKNLANAERQKEVGAQQGKNEAAASADAQSAQNALDLVDELRTDPNRERGTGKSAWLNSIPATAGYDYQTKVDQAKSGAFLTAIQQMRGMGALSNAEGSTATQAVTRMNTATTEKGFLDALDAYEKIVRQGLERAQKRMAPQGIQPPSPQGGGGATSSGVQWKVLP